MIKKIGKISNFGVFSNSHSIGGRTFKRNVIVYGKNKKGKSTLTSLFRSLMTKDGRFITNKKTFNSSDDIRIEIDFDGSTSTFRNGIWENQTIINPIYIFDSIFVHENIYQGEVVSGENENNLNNLILGFQGRSLQTEIKRLTLEISKLATEKSRISKDITSSFGLGINISNLLATEKTIDDYITSKKNIQDKISQYTKKTSIQKDLKLFISFLILDKENIEKVLSENVIVDIDGMRNHIEHIKPSMRSKSLEFMEQGIALLQDTLPRHCVFCSQELGQNEENLIKIFSEYFNGRYREVRDKIKGLEKYFKGLSLSEIDKWIFKFQNSYNLDIRSLINTERYEELLNGFLTEIEYKSKDLSYEVDFSKFDTFYAQTYEYIEAINLLNDTFNNSSDNITRLNQELKTVVIEEKRFNKEWVEKLSVYTKLETEAQAITTQRNKLLGEFNEYCNSLSIQYTSDINSWLSELQADFRLEMVSPLTGIRKQNDLYQLKINENIIKINGDAQNFSNSLSESDKRILAFAFFLATLSKENNLENSIVIFDDPINSLDHERKRITSKIIGELRTIGQLIILTHDREFLRTICKDPGFHDHKFFEIQKINGSATLVDNISVDDIIEDESRKLTKRVFGWLESGIIPSDYEKDCRRLIELIFEIKHHDKLKHLSLGSINTYALEVFKENPSDSIETRSMKESSIREFNRAATYLHPPLHDGTYPETEDGDRITAVQQTITCIKLI